MAIRIEKGVRLADRAPVSKPRRTKYPFHDMEIGDSFVAPCLANSTVSSTAVYHSALKYTKKTGRRFELRFETPESIRVWRTH